MSVDLPEVHARALDADAAARSPGWRDDQWAQLSDCDGWTVRELVNHIVTGNYWAAELGSGLTIEAVGDRLDGDVLGTDPLARLRRLRRWSRRRCSARRVRWRRRARCRTARSPGWSTAGTGSSTC